MEGAVWMGGPLNVQIYGSDPIHMQGEEVTAPMESDSSTGHDKEAVVEQKESSVPNEYKGQQSDGKGRKDRSALTANVDAVNAFEEVHEDTLSLWNQLLEECKGNVEDCLNMFEIELSERSSFELDPFGYDFFRNISSFVEENLPLADCQ
jgi:hypothetical protein